MSRPKKQAWEWVSLALRLMRTDLGVDALIRQAQTFNRPVRHQMLGDDFLSVLGLNMAIPDSFRVNHNDRAMLALVQAAGFVDTDSAAKTCGFRKLL